MGWLFILTIIFPLVVAIKGIQNTYGLTRITWNGDPCVAKQFMWDGLNCNSLDISTPPIITSL